MILLLWVGINGLKSSSNRINPKLLLPHGKGITRIIYMNSINMIMHYILGKIFMKL